MYGVFMVVFVVGVVIGAWWLLRRAFNADQTPEPFVSFGDLALGEKNARKERKRRHGKPTD